MEGCWILGVLFLLHLRLGGSQNTMTDPKFTDSPLIPDLESTTPFAKSTKIVDTSALMHPQQQTGREVSELDSTMEPDITAINDTIFINSTDIKSSPMTMQPPSHGNPIQVRESVENTSMVEPNFSSTSFEDQNFTALSTTLNDVHSTSTIIVKANDDSDDITELDFTDDPTYILNITRKQEQTPKNDKREPDPTTRSYTSGNQPISNKKNSLWVLILVLIIILILLLIIILMLLLRRRRRSGSQNFSKRSRKADGRDVWAGQVPELAEGKPVVVAEGAENGTVVPVSEGAKEEEMITFVSGEKKVDSAIEMNELVQAENKQEEQMEKKEDNEANEEQKPLLVGGTDGTPNGQINGKEEQFPLPPSEQELIGNMDKTI